VYRVSPLVPYFRSVVNRLASDGEIRLAVEANADRTIVYFTTSGKDPIILDRSHHAPIGRCQIHWEGPGTKRLSWYRDGPMSTYQWYWYPASKLQTLTVTEVIWHPSAGGG
jgi:hypothetical protein